MKVHTMENQLKFELTPQIVEELQAYSQLLNKDTNTILHEALTAYFENAHKKVMAQKLETDNGMTNLDFDEFWDGVDV